MKPDDEEQVEIDQIMADCAEEQPAPPRPTHVHGTIRANRARTLAEAEGISLGMAIARVMAEENKA